LIEVEDLMYSRIATRRRSASIHTLVIGCAAGLLMSALSAQMLPNAVAGLQPVKQADRVPANPDFGPLTSLSEKLPLWVKTENQSAEQRIDLGTTIHISVVLSRDTATETAFEQLLADQQNSSSPLYHQWLTPQQVGVVYGPTANDLAAVSSWLTSQGLKVDSIAPSALMIRASGTIATVGNAFHTSFGMFGAGSTSRLSAMSEPLIPVALSAVIHSVHGLTAAHHEPQSRSTLRQLPAGTHPEADLGNNAYAILPNDFAVIYDIAGVYSSGNKGATIGSKAQHVAILGKSRVEATDITNYETLAGLPSVQPTVVLAGTDPGVATGANVGFASEATLDVDRVIGTAPGVQADLVISADTANEDGIDIAMAYNIDTLRDPIMTISFGSCEAQNGAAETDFLNAQFQVAASEGISTFVSADDSGVAGCDTPFSAVTAAETPQVASINALCSSSYVTCVGGTEFNDTVDPSLYWSATNSNAGYESALSYIPEGAWNESAVLNSTDNQTVYQVAAGGGGVSVYIAKPSWQSGTGVPADGFRDVPDVSFTAADHDGYLGCFAAGGGSCVATQTGTAITVFSGTSAAAPGMAGIAALLNTKLGVAQGNINPMLYQLAASDPAVFHDVTVASSGVTGCTSATPSMCNNSTPGVSSPTGGLAGYVVTAGYDQATGLGSLDVGNLLAAATGGGATNNGVGSFTLAANPSALSVTPVANTTTTSTWTLTAQSVGGFAGSIALSCGLTPATSEPPACSITPGSIMLTADGTATATISLTSAGPVNNCLTTTASARPRWTEGASGVALAGLLLLVLPVRKRRMLRGLALVCLLGVGLGSMSGCGGTGTTVICSDVISAGTTAGTYTVTVTGSSGGLTETAPVTFTVTVN
jgi:pseudomonalisin